MSLVKIILSVGLVATLLTGCQNTVQGFGQDLEHTGREIRKSAN